MVSGDGEAGSTLLVWDTSSLEVKFCSRFHRRGVQQVAFSSDGALIAAVGASARNHDDGECSPSAIPMATMCLSVHQWSSGDVLFTSLIHNVMRILLLTESAY